MDALGVGIQKYAAVSDQWWLRAFDQGLKSLGTGQQTVLSRVQKYGVALGGLYGRFVKGEQFAGSIGQTPHRSLDKPADATTDGVDSDKMKKGGLRVWVASGENESQKLGISNSRKMPVGR